MHELNKPLRFFLIATLTAPLIVATVARADADDARIAAPTTADSGASQKFGPFGLLDKRSKYYGDWFPEPLRVEDTTLNNEFRFDYEHDEAKGTTNNQGSAEVQKAVGIVTLELRVPYVSNTSPDPEGDPGEHVKSNGVGAIEFAARLPVFQYVSPSYFYDNSIGFSLQVGIPTNPHVSKNTELAPGIFDDLRLGNHFSMQSLISFSTLFGSKPDEGRNSLEYGVAFGYAIEDEELPLPGVERTVPLFELVGETNLDGANAGHNSLTATVGFRLELKSTGDLQPQLGLGYIFPIDRGGRDDLRWGIIASLTLDF